MSLKTRQVQVSSRDDSFGNALAETIDGMYKAEDNALPLYRKTACANNAVEFHPELTTHLSKPTPLNGASSLARQQMANTLRPLGLTQARKEASE